MFCAEGWLKLKSEKSNYSVNLQESKGMKE
jgi:hypothetical protein